MIILRKNMKTAAIYWNPLAKESQDNWETIEGTEGNITQLTIAEDTKTGDYASASALKLHKPSA
jgi:hypothetical protein